MVLIPGAGIEAKHFSFISAEGGMVESLFIEGYGDFRQGIHGDLAWSHDPINGPAILSGAMEDQLRRGSRIFTPLYFMKDYASATAAGEEMIGEVDCNIFIFNTKTELGRYTSDAWQSVIADILLDDRGVIEVTFTPVALDPGTEGPLFFETRGYPEVAVGAVGESILSRLLDLSAAYGTSLELVDGKAVLRILG